MKYPTVWTLPPNNVEACYDYWATHEVTGEEWRIMLSLQRDPSKLIKESKTWILRSKNKP